MSNNNQPTIVLSPEESFRNNALKALFKGIIALEAQSDPIIQATLSHLYQAAETLSDGDFELQAYLRAIVESETTAQNNKSVHQETPSAPPLNELDSGEL